jgi:hypothetical protein
MGRPMPLTHSATRRAYWPVVRWCSGWPQRGPATSIVWASVATSEKIGSGDVDHQDPHFLSKVAAGILGGGDERKLPSVVH